jgi:hypothetical protein
MFIMFCEYMFRCYLFPFILLFSTSSIFELHVVVPGIVMFNILELIMEIGPNFPTETSDRPPLRVTRENLGHPDAETGSTAVCSRLRREAPVLCIDVAVGEFPAWSRGVASLLEFAHKSII